MKVKKLVCPHCSTEVEGLYNFPLLSALSTNDQQFIVDFIKASGSLKELSNTMGLSYPTIRNQLDEIIDRVNTLQKTSEKK
jgi:hypothetical protein